MNTDAKRRAQQSYFVFDVLGGFCAIAWDDSERITRFCLPLNSAADATHAVLRRVPDGVAAAPTPEIADVVDTVKRYFRGEAVDFSRFEVTLGYHGEFYERIYEAARQLAWGQTTTYGALAKQLGEGPEAARDVGQAMSQNRVPLIVPCHRVLAAGGKVGGFSAPGGAETKMRMLELEGVRLQMQQSLF